MKRSINLFSQDQLRQNQVRRLMFFWAGVIMAAVVFGLLEYHLQNRRYEASKSLLQNVENKLRPVRYMANRSDVLVRELQVLADEASSRLGCKRRLTVLIAKVLSSVQSAGAKISLERVKLVSAGTGQELRLSGISVDGETVDKLIDRLRAEKMFEEVTVESQANEDWEGIMVKRYELVCRF